MLLSLLNFTRRRWLLTAAMSAALVLAASLLPMGFKAQTANSGNAIYLGGDILTMVGDEPQYVEAIVVKEGKIAFAGTSAEAQSQRDRTTRLVNLQGKTLLPGLIDAHAHAVVAAHRFSQVDLAGAKSQEEVLQRLRDRLNSNPPQEGQWIVGQGYEATGRDYPVTTAADLDTVSPDIPIFIIDASFHRAATNTPGLNALEITANTPDPDGGSYGRISGTNQPDGRMDENAFRPNYAKLPGLEPEDAVRFMQQSAEQWMKVGVTTFTELGFGAGGDDFDIVKTVVTENRMPIDLKLFTLLDHIDRINTEATKFAQEATVAGNPADLKAGYLNRVQLAGVKMVMDGVPPDTAYLRQPYSKQFPGRPEGWRGLLQVTPEQVNQVFADHYKTSSQIRSHSLGDGAIEIFLNGADQAIAKNGKQPNARPICEHCAFTDDQTIARLTAIGAGATFNYAPGPRIILPTAPGVGAERMKWAIRTKSLMDAGVVIASVSDYPADALPPNLFVSAGWLINRNVVDGSTFSPQEKITPYQALKTMTINGAWILKEENTKGTLEQGKLADLVIVDKNPLKVTPTEFPNVRVLETIKEGKTVYVNDGSAAVDPMPAIAENGDYLSLHAHPW